MTNEMKLLKAFIEVSGYEIEEIKTTETLTVIGIPEIKETEITIIEYKLTKKPITETEYLLQGKNGLRRKESIKQIDYSKITQENIDPQWPRSGHPDNG